MNGPITLTTDFGLDDGFVGVMKGVILQTNPEAKFVDICHTVTPQDVREGAFILGCSYPYFPAEAIHIAIVDPGVGTKRRPIALATPKGLFVAPDNGVLSYILSDFGCTLPASSATSYSGVVALPPDLQAVHLNQRRYWLHKISATFHGRDIFAPVAAHLSLGVTIDKLGDAILSLEMFAMPHPQVLGTGTVIAHVLHVDRFGNLITDARSADLPSGVLAICVKGRVISGLSPSYAEGGIILAIVGSSDRLEIALRNGNAARELGVGVGEEVRIERIA